MQDLAVIYVVWAPHGHGPLIEFKESYLSNPAGLPHDLIVIYNGFKREADIATYEERLENIAHRILYIERPSADFLNSFTAAARVFDYGYFCFLNSRTRILAKDWLLIMYRYAHQKDVGIVGSTGSYESPYSGFLTIQRAIYGRNIFERFTRCEGSVYRKAKVAAQLRRLKEFYYYPPFPNPHVRTNAFMMAKGNFARLKFKKEISRLDALRLESGRRSITRQLLNGNLRAVIVGKDGRGFDVEDWWSSNTFRQGEQENLLFADGRTDDYLFADAGRRRILSFAAWGEQAKEG